MKRLLYLLPLAFIIASCSGTKWARVNVNDKYNLELPSYLEAGTFYQDASLQYKNEEKEFYMYVVDEDKAQFKTYGLDYDLETYFKVAARAFDSTGHVNPTRLLIEKDSAAVGDFKGNINGNEVYYRLVTIESKGTFYKMLIWMMGRDREKYAPDVERIVNSFREK
jgi:hypothetical protein